MYFRASRSHSQNSPVFPIRVKVKSKALTVTHQAPSPQSLAIPLLLWVLHCPASTFLKTTSFTSAFALDISPAWNTHFPGSYMSSSLGQLGLSLIAAITRGFPWPCIVFLHYFLLHHLFNFFFLWHYLTLFYFVCVCSSPGCKPHESMYFVCLIHCCLTNLFT